MIEILCHKRRVLVEKPLINVANAYRESNSGYGRQWTARAIIDAASVSALTALEASIQALADGEHHAMKLSDASAKWNVAHWGDHWSAVAECDVLVINVQSNIRASYPLSREVTLEIYEVD
jgi:hypothetical protein